MPDRPEPLGIEHLLDLVALAEYVDAHAPKKRGK